MKFINDLKKWYFITFESALILAMLLVLSAFKFPADKQKTLEIPKKDFDAVKTVEIPITKPDETPPKPPKPSTLAEVPNDEVIEDPIDDLDVIWEDGDNQLLPPPPRKDDNEIVFEVVEQSPEIKGGVESLYKEIEYPRKARLAGIEGTVYIQFVVEKDGSVRDAKVIRSIGGGCDEAALKAVKNLEFRPGRQRGIAVQVRMSLPVIFRLQ